MTITIDEIRDNFALLEEWDDRYRYVIELGRMLAPLSEAEHSAANKVQGCASQVWLVRSVDSSGSEPVLTFRGDSDAHIVRGLIAILLAMQSGKTARAILAADPKNAQALNALGYTLADRTTRYPEALGYIEQALALLPDDAAVLDSMGWVQYRLGDHVKALEYLRRAYQANPDAEIAAHLVEVLWTLGRQDEARALWERGAQRTPGDRFLQQVREKLKW